jgi:cation transport ATPase
LERLPGVKRADVKLETGQAKVTYDDRLQTPEKLAAAIDRLGFKASVVTVAEAPIGEIPAKRWSPRRGRHARMNRGRMLRETMQIFVERVTQEADGDLR